MGLWESRISLLLIVFFKKIILCVWVPWRPKRVSDPLKLELQNAVRFVLLLGVESRSLEEQLILLTWPTSLQTLFRLLCRFSGPVQEWNQALLAQDPGYSALKLSHCYISIKYLYMRGVVAAFIANINCQICFSATERRQLDSGMVDSFLSVSLNLPVFSLASEQEAS